MDTGHVASAAWLTLFPGILFTLSSMVLRSRPARLEKFLGSIPGPAPSAGEIRWLPRVLLMTGLSWLALFAFQVFPYSHGQRPFLIVWLEIILLSASAAAFLGAIIWIAIGRNFLVSDRPAGKD